MTKHVHHEPMEHLWPTKSDWVRLDEMEEHLRREYRAGFWGGMVGGIVSGLFLAPIVWVGLVMWGV